jgi:hypothetical protein
VHRVDAAPGMDRLRQGVAKVQLWASEHATRRGFA